MPSAPAAVAYKMADVLQWDVDFNKDLQRGDTFAAVYEEIRLDQRYHGVGNLQAVVLENGGRRLEAYRFGEGWYDSEGRPLAKLFLRSPLPYTRITSSFSHRRFHPVLKSYRPHYGVDYGAPVGTPVRATAVGRGGVGGLGRRRRQNGQAAPHRQLSHRLPSSVGLRQRTTPGRASGPGRGDRIRRHRAVSPPVRTSTTGCSIAAAGSIRPRCAEQPSPPIRATEMASFLEVRDQLREGLASGAFAERDALGVETARVAAGAAVAGGS